MDSTASPQDCRILSPSHPCRSQTPVVRIAVVFNPISGRGRSAAAAAEIANALQGASHEVTLIRSEPTGVESWLEPALRPSPRSAGLLVIVGGDGAVRLASHAASRWGVPIYQVPMGTENLFAREWGMSRRPSALLQAIARGRIATVDSARANGEHFLLMVSVGYDADVVHDLAAHRAGGISHLSYLGPMLRQMRSHQPSRLTIHVDGVRIDDGTPGFAVVANSRQYAVRLNPACRARMDSGHLDIVWFPCTGILDLVGWMMRCQLGLHVDDPRLVYSIGRTVTIESTVPFRHQLDGDAAGAARATRLEIAIRPRSLRVLTARDRAERPERM